jgi:hypothetical protein
MKAIFAAALLLSVSVSASAAPESIAAELGCEQETSSGRFVCRVDYRTTSGARLVWADALVTAAPPFVRPLRSRAVAAVERDGATARAGIALVPSSGGTGPITVRARVVVCSDAAAKDAGSCRSRERELTTTLIVP